MCNVWRLSLLLKRPARKVSVAVRCVASRIGLKPCLLGRLRWMPVSGIDINR